MRYRISMGRRSRIKHLLSDDEFECESAICILANEARRLSSMNEWRLLTVKWFDGRVSAKRT